MISRQMSLLLYRDNKQATLSGGLSLLQTFTDFTECKTIHCCIVGDIFTFRLSNDVCGVRRFLHCCKNWIPSLRSLELGQAYSRQKCLTIQKSMGCPRRHQPC